MLHIRHHLTIPSSSNLWRASTDQLSRNYA